MRHSKRRVTLPIATSRPLSTLSTLSRFSGTVPHLALRLRALFSIGWILLSTDFGLAGGLPPQARIARKIGWITPEDADTDWLNADAVNDIGIVQFDRDGVTYAYAIGVFTQRNLDQLAAWRLTKDISAMVWDFFAEERYPLRTTSSLEAG